MSNPDDLAKIQQAKKELAELESVYSELQADAALTAASMAPPPVGTVADVVSIGKSLWKGDWGGALLDVVGIIPIVGDGIKGGAKGTKIANKMKDVGAALKAARVKLAAKKQALRKTPTNKADIKKSMQDCGTQKCDKRRSAGTIESENTRQTGAGSQIASADDAYDAIRASTTDVDAIAKNTGIKPSNIQKVKKHLFYDEHMLDRYVDYGVPAEKGRFDSDIGISSAWKRLESGNYTPDDIKLLKHETAEAWYMKKNGPGYTKAHDAAQKRYPAPKMESN